MTQNIEADEAVDEAVMLAASGLNMLVTDHGIAKAVFLIDRLKAVFTDSELSKEKEDNERRIAKTYRVYRLPKKDFVKVLDNVRGKTDEGGQWISTLTGVSEPRPAALKHRPEGWKHSDRIEGIAPAQVILRSVKRRPHAIGLEASHLCHKPVCLIPDHLIWETRKHNMARNSCRSSRLCQCGNAIQCKLDAHPQPDTAKAHEKKRLHDDSTASRSSKRLKRLFPRPFDIFRRLK